MYNKNQFKKVNNKKILHKVKKQWVTISLALLMMIGGGAVATHVSANADTTANAKLQVTSNAPQSNSASNITDQAKALHNNMVRNAGLSQAKPASLGATKAVNTPKVVKTAKWDNADVNYYNNKVMELTGNGTINAQDVPKLPSGNGLYGTWSLKINKNNASINLNNSAKGGYFSANYNPEWNYFRSMDLSGLHTNNVTNMSNMFENDESLKNADLSGFNTSNVTSMDYMFSGDYELSSLNLNSFDTRKASMNKIFANDGNLTKLVLGDNAKLGSKAFSYTPFSSVYHTATQNRDYANYSDVSAFTYGSDGAVPAKYIYNYYPVNQNSIGINNGFNRYKLMMNNKGNDVTDQFKDGTLPQGTYYLASPVPVNFVTQLANPYGSNNYSDVNHKFGAFYPITQAIGNSDYNNESDYYNVSPLDFTSQVESMLTNDKTYQHDYTILPGSGYITTNKDGNGDDVLLLNIKINLNASKYLNDANNNIKSYLNNDQTYQNDLHDAAPYEDPETNNSDERSYNSDVKQLNSDYATTNHNLTEPSDARTVESTSNADYWATSAESNMASDEASLANAVNSNKASYAGIINENKMNIDTTISGIHAAVRHPYFDLNKLNASAKATLASDVHVANSASDTLRNSSWNPTYSNVSSVADIAKHTGSALNDINSMYRSVHSSTNSNTTNGSNSKSNPSQPTNLTPQPANTTDDSMVNGVHEYLSNDGKTLTVTGDMGNYAKFIAAQGMSIDYMNHNNDFSHVTTLNLGNATNLTNGIGLFARMPNLKTIRQVGNWDTSHLTDMSGMFANDRSLSDLTPLAHWDTSHVTTMNNVLSDTNVSDLSPIANWDTSNVKDMSEAFEFDNNLKTLAPLAYWNTSNNTTMFGMFLMDKNLSNVSAVANWNINNVKDMTEAFSGDSKLSDLTPFTNWNTRNINNMSDMFSSDNISNLSPLANWNTSNVTTMSDMFDGNNITDLSPLTNWKTINVTSMFRLFQNNPKLSNISPLSHWDIDIVNNMGQMFYGDPLLVNKTPIQNWHINNIGDVNPLPNDAAKSNSASSSSNTSSAASASSSATSKASSNTSSEASSSANSSASSQSSNQSSEASQISSSNVAPSSAQQSSDNNANNIPFVPSVNVPTTPSIPVAPVNPTPVVTSTQNNTTSMSDNNNSSVEPQTTNTTVNANTNSQVSNSTKTTVNKHHNARVARNHNAKRGSIYLFNTDFKGLSKRNRSVVTIKGVRAYKRTRKGRYVPVKNIKPNTKLAVTRVIKFGKITKLQLTNGWLVTSNKHFVSVKKFAKRAIKGIDASRYTRALRKSNYVLRHGRRHATRYIYRTAKKFNKANNAEKKAYRKFTRKHTNRNRKSLNKVLTNLNNLVNALLK